MNARDWFSLIRDKAEKLAKLEDDAATKRAAVLPKGQQYEPSSHGGASDGSAAMLSYIQADSELDTMRAEVEQLLERASEVLYGRSGRGGLAMRKDTASADCVFGYYLLCMTWREVADELVRPESRDGKLWCRMRARRAFDYMDRVGMESLIDS